MKRGVLAVAAAPVLIAALIVGSVGTDEKPALADELNSAAVPAAHLPWVLKAGGLCPQITAPLIAAQIEQESGWNPEAVSPAGAQGISQFMPGTWPSWGRDDDGNGRISPLDPGDAIMAQGRLMCANAAFAEAGIKAGTLTGSVTDLALAAYNAGRGAVTEAGGVPNFRETRDYVVKINALIAKYRTVGTAAAPAGPFGQRVVAYASKWIGKADYGWGDGNFHGPTNGKFDCSGLTLYAIYQASGGKIRLPHLAGAQVAYGKVVPRSQAAPGDLVFFHSPGDAPSRRHHVGIYLGDGKMVHAPTFGELVQVSQVFGNSYWERELAEIVRYG